MAHFILLSASFGSGHNTAAFQIKKTLEDAHHTATVIDLQEFFSIQHNAFFAYIYSFSEKIPFVWGLISFFCDTWLYALCVKHFYVRASVIEKFHQKIAQERPDVVVAIFPMWASVLARYSQKYKKTFVSGLVITDAGRVGWEWYPPKNHLDALFVIDQNTKDCVVSKFHHPERGVFVSFFPLHQDYFLDKPQIEKKKFLVVCTGLTFEFLRPFLYELSNKEGVTILVAKGRNEAVFAQLKAEVQKDNISFYDRLDVKMTLKDIDILVAKPG